jgi:hypothetical protein
VVVVFQSAAAAFLKPYVLSVSATLFQAGSCEIIHFLAQVIGFGM